MSQEYQVEYKTERYQKVARQVKEFKEKYRKDKEFLASVMATLQQPQKTRGVGGAALLKQYNQDVRIMRKNEDTLRISEALLRRAENNDKDALAKLEEGL